MIFWKVMGDMANRGKARRRILVVDDDCDLREILGMALEDEGYEVLLARDGAEALRQLREATEPPELIFLDLRMPVMNGWEFLEEQRRDPKIAAVPVVIITADSSAVMESAVRMAAGVLPKPFSHLDVINTAARFMSADR